MSNPSTMQNQTFKFVLNADATDQQPPSLATLTKLGLSAKEGTPNFIEVATTDEGIYSAEDDLGISYYFRGAVENNYVKFAGFYWRIIRINGDGTIRMIYDGTSVHANGESSTDRQVGTTAFNTNYSDNAYVGYMYVIQGSSTYKDTHANINSSTIKTANDNWYKTNIVDKGYSSYVADAIYCADRQLSTFPPLGLTGNGTGIQNTAYGFFNRVQFSEQGILISVTPSLKCSQSNDKFTVNLNLGNGKLTYPVGLITIDESNMAGGMYELDNSSYYLYNGSCYWSMSPTAFAFLDGANVWYVFVNGSLLAQFAYNSCGHRPVISLKSDIKLSGNGTMSQPFEVVNVK